MEAIEPKDVVAIAGLVILALGCGMLTVWLGVAAFGGGLFYLAHTMRGGDGDIPE